MSAEDEEPDQERICKKLTADSGHDICPICEAKGEFQRQPYLDQNAVAFVQMRSFCFGRSSKLLSRDSGQQLVGNDLAVEAGINNGATAWR